MAIILCIVMIILVISALIMMNVRSASSSNETVKRVSLDLNNNERKQGEEHLSKEAAKHFGAVEAIEIESEKTVLTGSLHIMTDRAYRQVLQGFKDTQADEKKQEKLNMKDEEYRNVLRSMNQKANGN